MPRSSFPPAPDSLEPTLVARSSSSVRVRVGLVLAAALALCSASAGFAQTVDPNLWVTNGQVDAIVRDGNTIYVGGYFNWVGPATGGGVPLDATTGALPGYFPKVAGMVRAVVSDGTGGWYIGGLFTAVGGLPRANLAHIASDLSVTAWNPGASNIVYALAVLDSTVYVGGNFTTVAGQPRNRIAALHATTGAATSWNPNANDIVRALVAAGSRIYVGGEFTSIGGSLRNGIAALDAVADTATGWNPNANTHLVYALALREPFIYVGGSFSTIGGAARNNAAAIHTTTVLPSGWNPNANSPVQALLVNGSTIYAGGDFTGIGGQSRNYLAALNLVTGAATTWNPGANSSVNSLAMLARTLYAGGFFTNIGGLARSHIAAIDSSTGVPTAWNPSAGHVVWALTASGNTVFAGGQFASIGGQTRNRIAAFDATTGVPTSWNPSVSGAAVNAIVVRGSTVYAGGIFTGIGGQARNALAAIDATSGAVASWNARLNGTVNALAIRGSSLYAGGAFDSAGGQPRTNIAALDVVSGDATAWIANANGAVLALAMKDSVLYAGGNFTLISGQVRARIAALDTGIGNALGWNPGASGPVMALAVHDSIVYAGGNFSTIGGALRLGIAAIKASTGVVTAWNAGSNGLARAVAASGSTVYAGGDFTSIGGQAHRFLAAVDASTGSAALWNADVNLTVRALTVSGTSVYAGGDFTSIALQATSCFAAITAVPAIVAAEPASGGNSGAVTVTLRGSGLPSGAMARLSLTGYRTMITGSGVVVAADGSSLTATFDLNGAAAGSWDVLVDTPDAQAATLPAGFTIASVEAPQLRVNVVGPALIRANRRTAFDLVIENPGNVDALDVPLWIAGVPLGATVELDFALTSPPRTGTEPDWNLVPLGFTSPGGRYVPVVIPRVPPGTIVRRIYLTIPTGVPTFQLRAALTPPWVDGNKFRACLTAGGVISDPVCMGGQLTAINAFLDGNPQLQALSGVGVWAKIAWQCEQATTMSAALAKAEQVLDFMIGPVEQPGSAIASCSDVLPPRWLDSLLVTIVTSVDPNDKLGAKGVGTSQQIATDQNLPYSIRFENASTATAPAQEVVITDVLDGTVLDLTTVSLDRITFGNRIIQPSGLDSYATEVDLRPQTNLLVRIAATLDHATGILSWSFNSIDPATGQPPTNPLAGFLPPNVTPPQGEGSVLFTVMPKAPLANGTVINNHATITFDGNAPVTTPVWHNSVDNASLGSHVLPMAANSDAPSVPVQWTAESAPQNLRDFTVYVAEDSGAYRVWRLNISATADTLVPPGDHHVHHYAFFSVARDLSGNIEAEPPVPDAATQSRAAVGEPGSSWRLALEGARPNPALGAMRVWFTLPSLEPATLEVIDIAGRRVLRREVGSLGAGPHSVTLAASPMLAPGLYFIRLAQGSRRLSDRVVVIR